MHKRKFYWHIHHQSLLEQAAYPIEDRISYIQCQKPADEIELRLRLLRPAKNVGKAYDRYHKALDTNWVKYNEGKLPYQEYEDSILTLQKKYFEKLHAEQCEPDCPWDWDQQTIFPEAH